MNPRRLIPYVVVLLVLVGTYAALQWHQVQREAQEKLAKKIFQVQEKDIGLLTLVRDGQTVRLVKQKHDWHLTAPLTAKADQATVDAMLVTLAKLEKERDLGSQKNLKPFGLEKPRLVVEYTAQSKSHRLAVGGQVPGGRDYYALKDQAPNVLLINTANKEALDRNLTDLRDKILLTFEPGEVKEVKIRTGRLRVDLEKTGPKVWRWTGKEDFKVRSDRVEALLRRLHDARIKEFPEQLPKNYRSIGLTRPQAEVTLVTAKGSETLLLGTAKDDVIYVRKGEDGPVVLVDQKLAEDLSKAATTLEDRRLWGGPVLEARKVVWGPPKKSWTGAKDKEFWELKGPEGQTVKQPAARLELALWKLQNLEYTAIIKRPRSGQVSEPFTLEVFAGGAQPVLGLEVTGQTGNQTQVKAQKGDQSFTALVPAKTLAEIRDDLNRLTAAPPPPAKK
jgi:hypothetical protein